MNSLKSFSPLLLLVCLFITSFFYSCSNNDPVTPAAGTSASVSALATTSVGNNSGLVVTNAKFLLEFVKLEKMRGHDDADIKEGPFVVDFNMSSVPLVIGLSNVPPGTYTEVHFKIHKHTPNEVVVDPDFGTTGVGFSGIIQGTFNGVAFTYRTAITASQEVDIDPPIIVSATAAPPVVPGTGSVNVTLLVDPSTWFVVNGQVVNPMEPSFQEQIDQNIRASFRQAFEDDDHDGHPDHDHGHGGGH